MPETARRGALDPLQARDPFTKVGGHRARQGRRARSARTAGDSAHVDVRGRTKAELLAAARRLALPGRWRMTKAELARAVARALTRAAS